MINKTIFTQMAKKVFRHQRGLRDPQIMHPEREWSVGLLIAVVFFVGCAAWSSQVYLKNKNVSADQSALSDKGGAVYREPQVKEALQIASKREEELQTLLGVTPTPPVVVEEPEATIATTTEEVAVEDVSEEAQAATTEEGE